MGSEIGRGFLILADISGFTRFVAVSELDHSRVILRDILKLIMGRFTPRLRIAEIEGDAVFAYALDRQFQRGETLLEIIETTYVDFRDKRRSGLRTATCECNACQMVDKLDLKFITHYGDFALEEIGRKRKPLGSSVNLLHRLAKNKVGENTGWQGYALFTEASLNRMDVHPLNVHAQVENYEHLGDVQTFSVNLDDRYNELAKERHTILTAEQAHVVLTRELPGPPDYLWEWLNDPKKRIQWMIGSDWRVQDRPRGRTGRGATNHCSNSGFIERILDWHPFSYFTVDLIRKPIKMTITAMLEPIAGGTRVSWRVRLNSFLPAWILRPICRWITAKGQRAPESFDLLARILEKERMESQEVS
jgi:uncharacterized protein YndB with AHSA1/START domain